VKKPPKKEALRDELVELLSAELAAAEASHAATVAGVTHPDAKQESDKDTRAIEQQYLARGQAERVETLKSAVAEVRAMPLAAFVDRPAALGALITAVEEDTEKLIFIAPQGGGTALAQGKVVVVTPSAPLGKALLGKRDGDAIELAAGKRVREIEIVSVR
jgi:transcription elongation GreA/GreB family factor